jgi:ABC-type spermidine/putrescine transport system permease subunit II
VAVLVLFSFQGTLFPDSAVQRAVAALVQRGAARCAADGWADQFAPRRDRHLRAGDTAGIPVGLGLCPVSSARLSALLRGFITLPLTVSYLIIGMGLLIFFNWLGVPEIADGRRIGHVVINLPLCFAIIYSQMGEHQANIERAARDLGAKEWQVLALITAPILWPALFASFFLSMTFSWDEFVIAFLLTRFDTTLPVEIWNLLRAGLNPKTNAVGSLVFGVSIVLAIIFELVAFRKRPQ